MYHSVAAITALLALSTRQIEAQVVLATNCYGKSNSAVEHIGSANPCSVVTPTTNFTSCCVVGDTCLENGICHYTHPVPDPPVVETRYYMGGCTDPTFSSPACAPQCSDLEAPDVVYNETTQIWHCCGITNGSIRCDLPTDETFTALAPSLLSATFTVAATPSTAAASPSSTSSTTTTTPPSAPTQTSDGTENGGGLSGGAKAGIGIGCAVVALAGLGVLIWFFARRRNMHAMEKQGQEAPFVEAPFMDYPRKTEVPVAPVELAERATDKKRDTIRAELG
ncbi:hypothetical protein N431DRAFT_561598 [Stipitochalara longipes BDJ]|nr:hypothetical protein N431DRAFT_561598 [Stipitochalara longipes BDJ]